jgi:hypothetical protein
VIGNLERNEQNDEWKPSIGPFQFRRARQHKGSLSTRLPKDNPPWERWHLAGVVQPME